MTKPTISLSIAATAVAGALALAPAFAADGSGFSMSLTAGVQVSDNRDNVSDDGLTSDGRTLKKEDDTQFRLNPSLSYQHIGDWYTFRATYRPTIVWYGNPREGGTEFEFNHGADASLRFNITPTTDMLITDNLTWSGDKDWNFGDGFEYTAEERQLRNDDYYRNKVSVRLDRDFTADLRGSASASYDIKRYDEDMFSDRYDEDIMVFSADLSKVLSRHFSFGVYSTYTIFDRGSHGSIEDDATKIDNGVSYWNNGLQLSYDLYGDRRVVFVGRTGYNYLWHEADEIEDDDMIGDTSFTLNIHQRERTGGALGFRVGKTYSDIFPYSSQDDMAFHGSVFKRFGATASFTLSADFEYRTRSYDLVTVDAEAENAAYWSQWVAENGYKASGDRDSIWFRIRGAYRFTEDLTASAFYSIEDVESDVDTSYTENVFGVSLTVNLF